MSLTNLHLVTRASPAVSWGACVGGGVGEGAGARSHRLSQMVLVKKRRYW